MRRFRVSMTLVILVWVAVGLLLGFIGGWSFATAQLPNCQEDEYLYPKDDYRGPGKALPQEYGCFPIDDRPLEIR